MTDNHLTICSLIAQAKNRPRQWTAARFKRHDRWLHSTWSEVFDQLAAIASGLYKLGLNRQDRVAILSNTRREWWISDLGILGAGLITVPIYESQRPEEVAYILNDSRSRVLIVENFTQFQKWRSVAAQCPRVERVVVIEGHKDLPPGTLTWEGLLEIGSQHLAENPDLFTRSLAATTPEDWATLIYTSGTTGEPKGVVLTHAQIMGEVRAVLGVLPLNHLDSSLAFLPFAHVLGRVEGWTALAAGFTLCFAESIDRLRFNLTEVSPTLLIAVPRVFEKLFAGIKAQSEANPAARRIFQWALAVGRKVSAERQAKRPLSLGLLTKLSLAEALVFGPLRSKLGGRLRFAISGGAPLAAEIAEFFHATGLLVLEGYGLTETTAAITANTPLHYRFGTVGRALPGVELKIAPDGEILVRGPMVMKEYFNQADATHASFVDGYFATGDIGEIDSDGFLRITDRKKDLIKTAGGKYVAPQKLENLLKMSPYVSQVLIHGDFEKYVVAVLTLNQERIVSYAKERQISYQNYPMLVQHPQIKGLIRGEVARVNAQLASYETIKNFAILPTDFTVDAGELTPSLKVKRKFCSEKYRDLIASLYD